MIQGAALSNFTQPAAAAASNKVPDSAAGLTRSFGEFLKNAIDGVSAQEKNVHNLNDKFLVGQAEVTDVMVASQQAELSLKLTSQVRNRVIEAYQEIMRTQM
ncbi:flagellar hook-basal body protein FliE [Paenibacillus beijingensis]|uniref:Flagellar hook-basal body complex protein FliE n=2 Tax=Paenibacillus beijingensis TaxID=1126833 RepID=A0A0D5NML0_9BACL|nr:flagellar hook-basal body protein FliE [Paenibacillus beijingensis]